MVTAMWLRLELRRRWRSLVVLGLLVALATVAVLGAAAGARRGAGALDRLLDRTQPATAVVSPFEPGFDWARVRALPEVAALTLAPGYTDYRIDEVPGYPQDPPYIPADRDMMSTIERPVVLSGRLADPARADEAVVTAAFAHHFGGVGTSLTVRLYTPAQLVAGLRSSTSGPPTGPAVITHVVGVIRSPWWSDEPDGQGTFIPSAGLFAAHRANFAGNADQAPFNALVRLRHGDADLPAFRADLARVSGRPDIDVLDRSEFVDHERKVLRFESATLFAFGMAALLASLVLIGQALGRYTAAAAADLAVLHALGLTRSQGTRLAVAPPGLAAALGIGVGVAGAVGVSAGLPFGTAALYEPAPGVDADPLVLGLGAALALFAVLAASGASAWWAQRAQRAGSEPEQRSAVVSAAVRVGLPVPVTIGLRFALQAGRGPTATPARPALVGAVSGILGIVAAFTFSAGVADASDHPERFGQNYALLAVLGFGGQDVGAAAPTLTALAADPDVTAVDDMRVAAAQAGSTSVPTFTYQDRGLRLVLTDGLPPETADDVVLAPLAAQRLGAHVGSSVPLAGDAGTATMQVTGIGFVPDSLYNDYDNGAWLTDDAYDRLFTGFKQHGALIVLRPGADVGAAISRLSAAASVAAGAPDVLVFPASPPQQLAEIQNVRVLPVLLGGFLVILAVGAVGNTLAMSVRRRRGDLAVLRALGMTPRQVRGIVITQASVLAAIGLLFGLPLGLALGRSLWRLVAGLTPLDYLPPHSTVLMLVVPATFLVAAALVWWPARQAARLPVGRLLRAE